MSRFEELKAAFKELEAAETDVWQANQRAEIVKRRVLATIVDLPLDKVGVDVARDYHFVDLLNILQLRIADEVLKS